MEWRDLSPDEEQTLAAVIALGAYRTFDGADPSGVHALTGQLIGLRAAPGASAWQLALDPGETTPVDLPDGPLPGRYFDGDGLDHEIVVSVTDGRLSGLELVNHDGTTPTRWPTAETVRPWG